MSEGAENAAQLLASESAADSVTAVQPVSFQFEKLNTDDDHEFIPSVNVVDELIHDLVEEPVVSPHSHNSDGSPGAAPGGRQLQATVSFNTGRRGSGTTNHSIGTTPSATSPLGHHHHHSETGGAIGSNRSPGVGSIRSTSTFNNKPSFATYEEESESDDDTTTNSHRALGSASLAGNKYTVSSKALKKGVPTPTTTTTTTSATTTTSGTKGSRASVDDEQKRLFVISPQGTASLASANFGSGSKLLRPSISIAEDIDPRTCASPKLAQNRPTGLRLMVPSANGGAPEIALQNSAIAGVYCTPEGEQALRNLVAAAAAQQIANMNVLTPQLGSALSGVTVDTTAGMWNGRDSMPTTPQEHYSRVMNSLPNTPFVTDGTPYYQTGYPGMPNFYQYQLQQQQQQQQKVPQSAKLKSPHSGAGNHSFVSVGSVANSADVGDLEGFNHHNPLSIIGDSHSSPHSGHWPPGQMHMDPHSGFSPADRYAAEYMQYHMMQQQQQHQFMHPLYGNFNINSTISPPPPEHSLAQPLPTTATTNSNQQQPPAKTNNSSITLSDALETDEAPTERQVTGQFFEVAGGAATPSQQASRAPPPGYIGAPRLPPPGYNSVVPEYPDPLQVMKGETGPDVSGGQPRTQYGSGKGGATRLVSRFMPPPPPSLQAARVMAVCQGRGDAYYSREIKNLDGQLKISPTHENIQELPSDPKSVAKTKADTISSLVMREHTVHNDGKTCVATGDFAFLTKTENTADWARAGYGPCYSATPTEGAPDTTFALFDTKSETFQAYLEVLMQWYARTVRAVGHNSPTHATAAQNPIGLHPSDSSITNLHNQSISIEDPMGASDATAAPAFGNSSSLSGSASNTKGSKLPSSYFALNNIPPCPRPEQFFEIDKEGGDEEAGEAKGLLVINDLDGFIKWNCAVHEWWSAQVQPRTIGYHLHLQQIRVQEGGGSQPNQQHHSQPHHQRESQQSQNSSSNNNTNGSRGGYNQNNRGGGRGGGGGSRGGAPSNHFTVQQQAPTAFNVPSNYPPQYQPMYHAAAPYGQPGMMMNPHHRQAPFGMPSANGYPQQPLPNNQQHPVSNWFQLVPQQRPDSQQLPW